MTLSAENVYLIETPLQLLNAVEAKRALKLENNHILIHVGGTGFPIERFRTILDEQEWDAVHYLTFDADTFNFSSKLIGKRFSERVTGICYDYQKWKNRAMLNRLARRYRRVRNIFLGNYLEGHQEYMRHFANMLRHDTLFILDDGTDTLIINEARKALKQRESLGRGVKSALRRALFEWDVRDAERVTFFSAYDMTPGGSDRLIKNNFAHMRSLTPDDPPVQEVVFLGQCLIEDGCIAEDDYMYHLTRVKKYFSGEQVVYVPHPRESPRTVEAIRSTLGFHIRKLAVPIEVAVIRRGGKPTILAAFFCSALVNCRLILGNQVKVKAFYMPPEPMACYRELSCAVYRYFQDMGMPGIELVREF